MKRDDNFYRAYSAIKRSFSKSKVYREVLNESQSKKHAGPRGGKRYLCAVCRKDFSSKDVQVDHVNPVVPLGVAMRSMTWCDVYHRTYCDKSNLQVVCSKCHKKKSAEENAERRKIKGMMKLMGCKPLLKNSLKGCE